MKIKMENRGICDTIVSIRRICYMDIEQNFNRLFQQKEGDKALLLLGIYIMSYFVNTKKSTGLR